MQHPSPLRAATDLETALRPAGQSLFAELLLKQILVRAVGRMVVLAEDEAHVLQEITSWITGLMAIDVNGLTLVWAFKSRSI